jgi:hypothetical protein
MTTKATRRATATLCVLFSLGVNAPAFAQTGWSTGIATVPLPSGGSAVAPLVVGPAGDAITASSVFAAGVNTLFLARFDRITATWTAAVPIVSGPGVAYSAAAIDGTGNVLLAYVADDPAAGRSVYSVWYDAVARHWSAPERRSTTGGTLAAASAIHIFDTGDATLVFHVDSQIYLSRFVRATGTWEAARTLVLSSVASQVRVSPTGDVRLVGFDGSRIRESVCPSGPGTSCSFPSDIATNVANVVSLTFVANAAGDAAVAWTNGTVFVARRSAAGPWGAAVAVSPSDGASHVGVQAGIDAAGNVIASWSRSAAAPRIQFARYSAAQASWSQAATLTPPGSGAAALSMNEAGHVFLAWRHTTPALNSTVVAARYLAASDSWEFVSLPTVDGASDPALGVDAGGSALAVWNISASAGGGTLFARWTGSLDPPTVIAQSAGSGTISLTLQSPPSLDPAWTATNIEYSLDDGASWIARAPASPSAPLALQGLTDTVAYHLRLRTVNAAGPGRASARLVARSGTDTAPGTLRVVSRAGRVLTLAWTPPPAGLEPSTYRVEGGLAGQAQVLATVPTGGAATQIALSVPDGTFFVRVTGMVGTTALGTSTSRTIAVGVAGVPPAPETLLGSSNGPALALSWRLPLEGPAPTGIRVGVTGALTTSLDLPPTESFSFPAVPPGTYTFTVSALSGPNASAVSNVVTLTFPGTCGGALNPPSAFSASTQGGSVFLDWMPPTSGEAVTGYLVTVTGSFTGTFPASARTLVAPAPPGSYTVRVAATGLCGTSAFSAPRTVVVP